MNLEEIKKQNLTLAREKGFGSRPEEIDLPEKIALIHSEISEAYDAFLKNNLAGKDGFFEEIADVLLRTLHLAGIYKIQVGSIKKVEVFPTDIHAQIALLHKAVSEAYEGFRHQKEPVFSLKIRQFIEYILALAAFHGFLAEKEAVKKMEYNRTRNWDKANMNEKFTS
ncbi:MAG: hypothetical protein AAB871_02535 [Patescibacteria group bacterium]